MEAAEKEVVADAGAQKARIGHRRVHWRTLILEASGAKKPAHIVEIADGSASLLSRYSYPVGSALHLAVFLPEAADRGHYAVTELTARVVYQVMRGDDVQTGLSLAGVSASVRDNLLAALRQET